MTKIKLEVHKIRDEKSQDFKDAMARDKPKIAPIAEWGKFNVVSYFFN